MISLKNIKNFNSFIDVRYGVNSGADSETKRDIPSEIELCLDSRLHTENVSFLAISGENFNAVNFLKEILKKSCPCIFYTKSSENNNEIEHLLKEYPDTFFIETTDSIEFFQELMQDHLNAFHQKGGKTIAISGSNGKTTTKEMIHALLDGKFPNQVEKTQKNNNNHIGVPLTILQIKERTKYLVLELGSNHPGEQKVLCDIAQPKYSYVTNIGQTHMEFFPTLEDVFNEEALPLRYVQKNKGVFFQNTDDEYLNKIVKTKEIISIGESDKNDFHLKFSKNGVCINDLQINNSNLIGEYNFRNLATAMIISSHLSGLDLSQFQQIAESYKPQGLRSSWKNVNNSKVFLDAYNANPSSMILALQAFYDYLTDNEVDITNALLVIGDMNELGDMCQQGHIDVAQKIEALGFRNVVFIGQYFQQFKMGINKLEIEHYAKRSEYDKKWKNEDLNQYPYHFLKASRSLQLEALLDIT